MKFEEAWDGAGKWRAWASNRDAFVLIGDILGKASVDGEYVFQVEVAMPHQCDEWEVMWAHEKNVEKKIHDLDALVADLTEIKEFLTSDEFPITVARLKGS